MGLYAWGSCWRLLEGCPQEYGVKAASQWICDRFAPDSRMFAGRPLAPAGCTRAGLESWAPRPPLFSCFRFLPPSLSLGSPGPPHSERLKTLRPAALSPSARLHVGLAHAYFAGISEAAERPIAPHHPVSYASRAHSRDWATHKWS